MSKTADCRSRDRKNFRSLRNLPQESPHKLSVSTSNCSCTTHHSGVIRPKLASEQLNSWSPAGLKSQSSSRSSNFRLYAETCLVCAAFRSQCEELHPGTSEHWACSLSIFQFQLESGIIRAPNKRGPVKELSQAPTERLSGAQMIN
jgi:hypothetical protein